jgi:type IV pilus assembly protein PilA
MSAPPTSAPRPPLATTRPPARGNKTLIIILVVVAIGVVGVAMLGIVAAIAVPGLLRARTAGNEASAIGSLRAINSAQASYSASCAQGGYAVTLDDLVKPPTGSTMGFVSSDLSTNGVVKSGYRITLARDAAPGTTVVGTAAATCNGSVNPPASSYVATAEPVTPGSTGTRYFATDTRGTVFQSSAPISNPIPPGTSVVQ